MSDIEKLNARMLLLEHMLVRLYAYIAQLQTDTAGRPAIEFANISRGLERERDGGHLSEEAFVLLSDRMSRMEGAMADLIRAALDKK